ncbi:MlaD family protein [Nocardia asteroides]|uniref:MlaD family protein n=1 Tax=Nocardia asteroides TaxID=1824 RepID=UPI0037C53D80
MKQKNAVVLAVATIATVGVATTLYVAKPGDNHSREYCAMMADGIGLYPGNPVTQMGYPVGKVVAIDPQGAAVRVRFDLELDRKLPADVKAVTRSKSILADRSLELVGNYQSGPELSPDRCVDLRNTATPKSISEIAGSAADFIGQIVPDEDLEPIAGSIDGLSAALAGQGRNAQRLMLNAQAAMSSPDKMVADIGTIIFHLAPLTTQALVDWNSVRHIADLLPTVVNGLTYGAWPGVDGLIVGMGPLIAAIYEIQAQYGNDIWPLADRAADAIRLAATKADDIEKLVAVLPTVAAFFRQNTTGDALKWQPPTVNGVPILDLMLAKENK